MLGQDLLGREGGGASSDCHLLRCHQGVAMGKKDRGGGEERQDTLRVESVRGGSETSWGRWSDAEWHAWNSWQWQAECGAKTRPHRAAKPVVSKYLRQARGTQDDSTRGNRLYAGRVPFGQEQATETSRILSSAMVVWRGPESISDAMIDENTKLHLTQELKNPSDEWLRRGRITQEAREA